MSPSEIRAAIAADPALQALAPDSQAIADTLSSLTVTASGCTVDSSTISGTKCVAWISGGVAGETATVRFRFTTAGGRTDDRTIFLKIKDR